MYICTFLLVIVACSYKIYRLKINYMMTVQKHAFILEIEENIHFGDIQSYMYVAEQRKLVAIMQTW